jgi:hypothetical protein
MSTANSTGDGLPKNKATSLEVARRYIQRGLAIIPIPHRHKAPLIKEWPKLRITEANAHDYFNGKPQNIGVILGAPSGNLIDIDLDCPEAVKLAPYFLPKTGAIFGRASSPQAHYIYFSEIEQTTFKAPDGKMLLELRSTGGQTVFPGSTHPSGEVIEWNIEGAPSRVVPTLIGDAVAQLAACTLLSQAWRIAQGSRHDLALAIAGGLARAGWDRDKTIRFIVNAGGSAGDQELHDRMQAVSDTFAKADVSKIKGWPSAAAIIGDKAVQRIREFLGITASESGDAGDDLPLIKVNDRLPVAIADETLRILCAENDPPELFVRSGRLTRVRDDENGKPIIESLTDLHLREALGRVARFVNQGPKGFITIYPPMPLVQDIRARTRWPGLPPLEAITETPTLRHDGSILNQAGYDVATRLIYHPAKGFIMPPVPHGPTRGEIEHAIETINDVLCDFPFENEASRANAFALILTPIIRPLIDLAPLAVMDAPQAGTGKGKLTDLVSIIATGRSAAKGSAPTDADELEKRITALLSAGSTFVVFDDVAHTLRSPVLASALTASEWTGRILGRSEMIAVPQRATWVVTGNNIQLGGDIPRRCFWIRLDAKTSRPYLRDGFKHPNLETYVKDNRGALLAALLTLGRGWHDAGCPRATVTPLGSFEQWTRIIGGILEIAGIKGFLANASELYEQADDDSAQWEDFMRACLEAFGSNPVTISELAIRLVSNTSLASALPESLAEARTSLKGDFRSLLGKALAKRADRRYGDEGLCLTRAGQSSHKKVNQWQFTKQRENEK